MSYAPTLEQPLRGIILRGDDDKLVVQATASDVMRFAERHAGREARVQATMQIRQARASFSEDGGLGPDWTSTDMGELDPSGYLYDREGRPVAVVREVVAHSEMLDVTGFGDTARQFMRGQMRVDIRASGLPGVTFRGQRV